jgi:hypothetical protein
MNLLRALPTVLILLPGCRSERPEVLIQKAFDVCVKAIEAGDATEATESLSPRFSGPEGMNRDEARLYLMGLLKQEKVGITVFSSRIQAKGSQAQQAVELLLTSRSGAAILPQDASRRLFQLRWELMEGEWRLRSIEEVRTP